MSVLTLDVEHDSVALAVALLVAAHAGVDAGAGPRDVEQREGLVADYCAGAGVVKQRTSLYHITACSRNITSCPEQMWLEYKFSTDF